MTVKSIPPHALAVANSIRILALTRESCSVKHISLLANPVFCKMAESECPTLRVDAFCRPTLLQMLDSWKPRGGARIGRKCSNTGRGSAETTSYVRMHVIEV